MPEPKKSSERIKRGRESEEKGRTFETDVAGLYKLLHYSVRHGMIFSGRQVDLLLERKLGDLKICRAVECKSGLVNVSHIDSFLAKLRLVRRKYAYASGTIVSGKAFTDSVASHASAEGVQLTHFNDLQAELFDGIPYARALQRECESDENYPLRNYVEQDVTHGTTTELSSKVISLWLEDQNWQQITLLGDVGTGKTFLTKMLAYQLASKHLENPRRNPLPIRIDLRHADRQFTLEGLVLSHLARYGLADMNFSIFNHALLCGRIVLVLDGFDEMSARVTPGVTRANFDELARAVSSKSKVLLTCRTHYFRSRTEEEEAVLGSGEESSTESARELYWDLISRRGFRIAYLKPFDIDKVEQYLRLVLGGEAGGAIKRINGLYNLMELCSRPLLLDMIVKSIDKLDSDKISAGDLYGVFTDAWVHREKWRDVLSPAQKLDFLAALSRALWADQSSVIHHRALSSYVGRELAGLIQNPRDMTEIDHEIRTASFLVRDEEGYYGFAHKSYKEYFLARFIGSRLKAKDSECLAIERLTPEICGFIADLFAGGGAPSILRRVLLRGYQRSVSENALLCLYTINRREGPRSESSLLPEHMKLQSARLEQVNLEDAELRFADLRDSTLTDAQLANVDLTGSNLKGADLTSCQLAGATFRDVDARGVSFEGSNLDGAIFEGSRLKGANFSSANVLGVKLEDVDLAEVVGFRLPDFTKPSNVKRLFGDIERLRELAKRAVRTRTASSDEIDAIISDSFIKLFAQYFEELEGKSEEEVMSLLQRVMYNSGMSLSRSQQRTYDRQLHDDVILSGIHRSATIEAAVPPDEIIETRELKETILAKLRVELSEEAFFVFCEFLEGASVSSTAAALGASTRKVQRLRRVARQRALRIWAN